MEIIAPFNCDVGLIDIAEAHESNHSNDTEHAEHEGITLGHPLEATSDINSTCVCAFSSLAVAITS